MPIPKLATGRLRRRVTIERPTYSTDDYGSPGATWETLATVWARVDAVPQSSPSRISKSTQGAVQSLSFYRVTMRYLEGLRPGDRINLSGSSSRSVEPFPTTPIIDDFNRADVTIASAPSLALTGWYVSGTSGAGGGIRNGALKALDGAGVLGAIRGTLAEPVKVPLGGFEVYCDVDFPPQPVNRDGQGEPTGTKADVELWIDGTYTGDPFEKFIGIFCGSDVTFFQFGHSGSDGGYGPGAFVITIPVPLALAWGDGIGMRGDAYGWAIWHRSGVSGTWRRATLLSWDDVAELLVAGGETETVADYKAFPAPFEIFVNSYLGVDAAMDNVGGGAYVAPTVPTSNRYLMVTDVSDKLEAGRVTELLAEEVYQP